MGTDHNNDSIGEIILLAKIIKIGCRCFYFISQRLNLRAKRYTTLLIPGHLQEKSTPTVEVLQSTISLRCF